MAATPFLPGNSWKAREGSSRDITKSRTPLSDCAHAADGRVSKAFSQLEYSTSCMDIDTQAHASPSPRPPGRGWSCFHTLAAVDKAAVNEEQESASLMSCFLVQKWNCWVIR